RMIAASPRPEASAPAKSPSIWSDHVSGPSDGASSLTTRTAQATGISQMALRAKMPMLSASTRPIENRIGRGNAASRLIQSPKSIEDRDDVLDTTPFLFDAQVEIGDRHEDGVERGGEGVEHISDGASKRERTGRQRARRRAR